MCNFCRGKRTGNLPDKVRAQVLVNGGHCEGCAGDDSLVVNRRRRLSVSPIAGASEIREGAVLMPRNVELRKCLRQRLQNSRLPSAKSRDRMSVEARSWGSAPACAACEGVQAPFDGQTAREIAVVLLPWLSTLLDVTPFLGHTSS